MKRLSNYLKFQLTFWTFVPLFYSLKERELPWPWVVALFFTFATAGFLTTHLYRSILNKKKFAYDNVIAASWPLLGTLSLLSLAVVVFDFLADRYYYHIGFENDDVYYLTLAGYYADGFIIFLPWFFVFHLYQYGKKVGELNRVKTQQQADLQQAQLEVVLNKLNPHFLFNTLNTIRWLISKNNDIARQAVGELSEIMRYSTRQHVSARVTIEEELTAVKRYLNIERWRFDDTLDYTVVCDAALTSKQITPFLILNVVENAVKHGIQQSLQGGTIAVQITSAINAVQIEVSNPGRIADVQTGFGLDSVNKLLKSMFGESSGLSMTQQDNRVVTTITVYDTI